MFRNGKYQMKLLVLEFSGFSHEFHRELLGKDAATPVSVKLASRKSPNWSKIHAQEIEAKRKGTAAPK